MHGHTHMLNTFVETGSHYAAPAGLELGFFHLRAFPVAGVTGMSHTPAPRLGTISTNPAWLK